MLGTEVTRSVGIPFRPSRRADHAGVLHETALMSRKPVRLTAATALLILATAACSSTAPDGTALANKSVDQDGVITIRVGTETGLNAVWLDNPSRTPITVESVRPIGEGTGTVVRQIQTQIAVSGPRSVPVSVYAEDPPVARTARGCVAQALRPLAGYQLMPGKFVTLWTVLLSNKPGRYN